MNAPSCRVRIMSMQEIVFILVEASLMVVDLPKCVSAKHSWTLKTEFRTGKVSWQTCSAGHMLCSSIRYDVTMAHYSKNDAKLNCIIVCPFYIIHELKLILKRLSRGVWCVAQSGSQVPSSHASQSNWQKNIQDEGDGRSNHLFGLRTSSFLFILTSLTWSITTTVGSAAICLGVFVVSKTGFQVKSHVCCQTKDLWMEVGSHLCLLIWFRSCPPHRNIYKYFFFFLLWLWSSIWSDKNYVQVKLQHHSHTQKKKKNHQIDSM